VAMGSCTNLFGLDQMLGKRLEASLRDVQASSVNVDNPRQ